VVRDIHRVESFSIQILNKQLKRKSLNLEGRKFPEFVNR